MFHKEFIRVAGTSCVLTVAHSDNLTLCDQVRLLSRTDVFISAHGAQMTNLVFMDRKSSIMELYLMGWRQFVFHAGMRHEGSWWDPAGDPCPDGNPDIFSCYKNRWIGMDEAAFTEFAAKVFAANKGAARRGQEAGTNCKCS